MRSYTLQLVWAVLSAAIGAVRAIGRWCGRHRLRLIPGWQHGWRMLSVQAAALLVVVNAVQQALSASSFGLPPQWLPPINAVLGAAVILLRLLDQPELRAALDALLGPAPVQTGDNQTHAEADASKTASATGGETAAPLEGGVAPHKTTQQGAPARPPFDPYDGRWR